MTVAEIAAWSALLTSTIGAIASAVVLIRQAKIAPQVRAIHREVQTTNGHTLAGIVEANAPIDSHDLDETPKIAP